MTARKPSPLDDQPKVSRPHPTPWRTWMIPWNGKWIVQDADDVLVTIQSDECEAKRLVADSIACGTAFALYAHDPAK